MRVTRRFGFCASHRLARADRNDARNREVFGARATRKERGHNYALEVTVRARVDPETGMVVDLTGLKRALEEEVGARLDHRNLNDDTPFFRTRAPTLENLGLTVFEILSEALPELRLERIRLAQSEDLSVEVGP